MNTATSTFLDLLAVAFVFLLLALPSLVGHARDLRIDRQLRDAERADAGRAGTPEGIPAHPKDGYGRAA
ncbi:hypothetical protein ACIQM4_06060 [Streptomyces sp. NPDC091272]|uniref:hypothetical protein n=1 Tax=Streptomyces sp. NPDC091272 TaxID=3365981 RepID=UPI0038208E72